MLKLKELSAGDGGGGEGDGELGEGGCFGRGGGGLGGGGDGGVPTHMTTIWFADSALDVLVLKYEPALRSGSDGEVRGDESHGEDVAAGRTSPR